MLVPLFPLLVDLYFPENDITYMTILVPTLPAATRPATTHTMMMTAEPELALHLSLFRL